MNHQLQVYLVCTRKSISQSENRIAWTMVDNCLLRTLLDVAVLLPTTCDFVKKMKRRCSTTCMLSICPYLSVCLSVCLSVRPFVYLSGADVCLPTSVSVSSPGDTTFSFSLQSLRKTAARCERTTPCTHRCPVARGTWLVNGHHPVIANIAAWEPD